MARTTRSAAIHPEKTEDENQNPSSPSPAATTKAKVVTKKRKRGLGTDSDDLPSTKQTKGNDDEALEKGEDDHAQESEYPPLAGEVPMTDEDAQKILDILEMADTQGLLDRVFPLDDVLPSKPSSTASTSKTPSDSYSLRTLLKESKVHPLRVFRSAIKQLHPISSQPRARISPPAAQQLRFCQLALSLIEQASRHNTDGLALKPELILSNKTTEEQDDTDAINMRRKYALVQRLPTGDLWTSLDSDVVGSDAKPLSELNIGHAELVAILPSSSASAPIPTLGELHADKKVQTRYKPPTTRHVSCGSFLDYGPFASFAPAFDSDGSDIGRIGVSNVLWHRHEKGKAREKARILGDRLRSKLAAQAEERMQVDDVVEIDPAETKADGLRKEAEKRKELLEKLFGQEGLEILEKVLGALEREESTSELLLRNAKALVRLQELQGRRLRGENNGSTEVQVGSEEWNLAQSITDSLTLLMSMRPRKSSGEASAIIPPASVLHVLQQTLPSGPSQGWYGTLSESRGFAVRDDMTLRTKGPLEITQVTTAPTAPATPTPAPVTQTPASAYSTNYSYAGFAQHYRTGTSMPYTNQTQNQASGYFAGTPPQAQKANSSQYGSSSQYTYGSWFPGQPTASAVGTPTPGSRRGTPQPSAVPAGSFTNSTYLPYSAALAAAAATPGRAVANTVAAKPQANGWSIPGATVGTPTPVTGGFALPSYLRPGGGIMPASPLASGAMMGPGSTSNYAAPYQATATPPANT